MNSLDPDNLRKQIQAVFGSLDHPNSFVFSRCLTDRMACEYLELPSGRGGIDWIDVDRKRLPMNPECIYYLRGYLLRYYLPAFMLASLEFGMNESELESAILNALGLAQSGRPGESEPDGPGCTLEFTREEREVIVEYVQYVSETTDDKRTRNQAVQLAQSFINPM